MAEWYVFQHDGAHLGPWSTERVSQEIRTGGLAPDVWVAAPAGPRWLRARDVPAIARLAFDAHNAPARRRESGLRLAPNVVAPASAPRAAIGQTVMMVSDEELEIAPRRAGRADDERDTEPWLPPSSRVAPPSVSSTALPDGEAVAAPAPSPQRRRRRRA